MTRRPLALALAVAFGGHGLCPPAAAETVLGTVSVEAQALEEPLDETAATSSLTADQLRRDMAQGIKDAVRYEAGISVTNNASRFGQAGYNIRGVDGDRVAMEIDGVRLPDEFKTGGYANAGRNMVDVRLLKQIDFQRGSGSVLYGSGALGGAVSYVTPDPEDYLSPGRRIGGSLGLQYFGANDARALLPAVAAGSDTLKLLVSGVVQHSTETESMGSRGGIGVFRTQANPQDEQLRAGLIKLAYTPHPALRTSLTWEDYARDVDTDLLSQSTSTITRTGADTYRRKRISLEQRVGDLPIGALELHLYSQRSNTHQTTYEVRRQSSNPNNWEDAVRSFDYDQDSIGLRLHADSTFQALGAHRVLWGIDLARRETAQVRDGETRRTLDGWYKCVTAVSGIVSQPTPCTVDQVNGQPYPDRDFPLSTVDELGAFIQDNWMLTETWSLTFGVRYDRQRLSIEPDALYLDPDQDGVLKTAPTGKTAEAFSPKLGATWRFRPHYALSLSYSYGFRTPPYDSVNYGFENRSSLYMTMPNPALEPEYSRGPEARLAFQNARGYWNVSAYQTHYTDFMELDTLCHRIPRPDDQPFCGTGIYLNNDVYQTVNLPRAEIHGVEAGFGLKLDDRWRARGSLTYARGRDYEGNPLSSIDPLKAVVGLAYNIGPWELGADLTLVDRKRREDARHDDNGAVERLFLTKGYGVLDLRAHWRFAKTGLLSLGILNVFDRKYSQWADVPVSDIHIIDSQQGPERYSQPGRNATVSLSYDFK